MDFLMLRCKDQSHYANRNVWFWTRPVNSKNCIEIVDPPHSMKHKEDADLKAEDIVFVAQVRHCCHKWHLLSG